MIHFNQVNSQIAGGTVHRDVRGRRFGAEQRQHRGNRRPDAGDRGGGRDHRGGVDMVWEAGPRAGPGALLSATACHFTLADNPAQYSCGGDFICPPGRVLRPRPVLRGRTMLASTRDAPPPAPRASVACKGACACDATCTGSLSCNGANRCIQGSCKTGGTGCSNSSQCCSAVCSQTVRRLRPRRRQLHRQRWRRRGLLRGPRVRRHPALRPVPRRRRPLQRQRRLLPEPL